MPNYVIEDDIAAMQAAVLAVAPGKILTFKIIKEKIYVEATVTLTAIEQESIKTAVTTVPKKILLEAEAEVIT